MRKRWFVLLASLLAVLLTACGSPGEQGIATVGDAPAQDKPVVTVFKPPS